MKKRNLRSDLSLASAGITLLISLTLALFVHMRAVHDNHKQIEKLSRAYLNASLKEWKADRLQLSSFGAMLPHESSFTIWKNGDIIFSSGSVEASGAKKDLSSKRGQGAFEETKKDGDTFLFHVSVSGENPDFTRRIIAMYLAAILISAIIYLINWILIGPLLKELTTLRYEKMLSSEQIDNDSSIQKEKMPYSNEKEQVMSQSTDNNLLLQYLYEKPYKNLEDFELALYPAVPKASRHDAVVAAQHDNYLDFAMVHFENQEEREWIELNRIQERMFAFSDAGLEATAILHSLTGELMQHRDKEPSLIYLRYSLEDYSIKLLRSGNYLVHLITADEVKELETGEMLFSSNLELDNISLSSQDFIVVSSLDIAESTGVGADDFSNAILQVQPHVSPEDTLKTILRNLYNIAENKNEYPSGSIAVIAVKSPV